MKARWMFAVILCLISTAPLWAKGPSDGHIPAFRQIFEQLSQKRNIYNAMNDSLFMVDDEDAWVKLILRRSDVNYKLYVRNQQQIDKVTYYFLEPQAGIDATSGKLKERNNVPDAAYDSLWVALDKNYRLVDPFIGEIFIGKILLPHIERVTVYDPSKQSLLAHLYLNYGDCLYQMFCMGDSTALPQCYQMLRKCIGVARKCPRDSEGRLFGFYAASHMLARPRLDALTNLTDHEAASLYRLCETYLKDYEEKWRNHYLWRHYASYIRLASSYYIMKLRILILQEDPNDPAQAQEINRLMNLVWSEQDRQHFRETHYIQEFYSMDMLFRTRSGKISFDAAIDSCRALYEQEPFIPVTSRTSFTRSFHTFVYTAKDIAYMLQHSSLSDFDKAHDATLIAEDAVRLLRMRPDNQFDSSHSNLLMLLLLDPNFLIHLPHLNRLDYMDFCFSSVSVHTLAHYRLVAHYADMILSAVFKVHPEALIGCLGYKNRNEVLSHQEQIRKFLQLGCMLHDLGKIQMEQIINNEFRKLTDHEFSIIKLHPERCLLFTGLDPFLQPYEQFALGHHRWYDGTKGYPAWYDNTQASERILVDILLVADCLEAATNRMSRNYRRSKTFTTMMTEFEEQAGTRYNPLIVDAIRQSEKEYQNLEKHIRNSWKIIFSDIFQSSYQPAPNPALR